MRISVRCPAALILTAFVLNAHPAYAIPSFSAQTGQACASCHVGGYGPQLKPYGRDFKMNGYVASAELKDNFVDNWYERFSGSVNTSFTHTKKDIPPSPGGIGYGPNNNLSVDQVALFYGGRITSSVGAMAEVAYDGINRVFHWDAMDIRHAWDGSVLGNDYTAGITLNNQVGYTTVWNTTSPWSYPYDSSGLAPGPAGTFLDDGLGAQVLGGGAYVSSGWVYAEGDVYFPLNRNFGQAVGTMNTASDKYVAPIPYWHLALEHGFDNYNHYAQIGTFGATALRQPGNDQTTGLTDRLTDIGFEANYQYLADLHNVVSAHATFVRENQNLRASQILSGTNGSNHLNTFKTDVTYAIDDTYVPSVQYFKTTGSSDAALYADSANGSPNSDGFTVEMAYVPFGKPDSVIQWGNARLSLAYTAYTRFNGTSKNAADNNTLFLNLSMSLDPLVPAFGKSH